MFSVYMVCLLKSMTDCKRKNVTFLYETVGVGETFVFGNVEVEMWSGALFSGFCLLSLPSPVCVPPSTVRWW